MDKDLKAAIQPLMDAVAELQGRSMAIEIMVEAILMSHPDPDVLRDCWDQLACPRIAQAELDAAMRSQTVDHATACHLAKWTEKLDRHQPMGGPGKGSK
ncbi:MAG TPA: hypothetical protein VEY92_11355 [Pseudoxanthomonas sp.]|nr:hypothetical protein [Pseudoxanthomonas sp.]